MQHESIHQIIRDAEHNYIDNAIDIGEYVDFDMHDVIETIYAYLNSRHISGKTDSLGREKPFFNIVTAAVNIWYRATDIDRKNIRIMPANKSQVGMSFIANVLLKQWMREARFGVFLNDWGRTLAQFGSAVVKFVEKDGKLEAIVVPWNRLIVDPIDFDALPRIEKLYRTPAQLQNNPLYDQEVVKSLLDAQQERENLDGTKKDDSDNFIEIYEVHGQLPEYLLKDEYNGDKYPDFVQQMHVVCYVKGKDGYNDFTLYRGREKKDPYMITHLMKEDGRTLSIGAVEYLFDAQWMVNHTQKNIKDTLDLASKLIFQTSDTKYVGRNVLSAIETGDVMIHANNEPLTRLANDKPDISAFQNFGVAWQNLAQELTSTPDSLRGATLPSGTPYSLGAFLGGQANSLFELMTENKGLALEDMMREYIIPHLKKKMDTKDEVVAILEADEIAEIDAMFIPKVARKRYNEQAKQQLINGEIPEQFDVASAEQQVAQEMNTLGNKRFFKPSELDTVTWKEALKDMEMRVIVEVTNENTDKQAVLTTLSTLLQTVASNPAILQDKNAQMLFNAILTETGRISPIQLSTASTPTPTTGGADALQALSQNNNVGTSNA